MRAVALGLLALALLLPSGCAKKKPTAPVSGLVTFKGKALTRGRVLFNHDSGQYGFGDIGADGRYKLEAPLGECRVAVTCREEPPPNPPPGMLILKSLIPERYEDHMRSGLKFDVKEGENTADWKLE
jgi:hypothetical protein